MPSLQDYAVLSAAVYNDVRQNPNRVVLPTGWTRIGVQPSTLIIGDRPRFLDNITAAPH